MAEATNKGLIVGEAGRLVRLASPIVVNNLAISFTSLIDVVMAGRLGAKDLAAVGVGNAVWASAFLFGLGVLMAVSTTVAHRVGAGALSSVGAYTRQAFYIAIAMSLVLLTILYGVAFLALESIGIDPDIVPRTRGYLAAMALGLPGIYLYLCLRYTSEGVGHTAPIMFVAIAGLLMNAFGNYVLMFGKLGFPALGAVGCGLSSAISMWLSLGAMLWYVRRRRDVYEPMNLFQRFDWPDLAKLRELLALGLPIGGSVLAEVSLFSSAGLIMGVIGANAAAAHAVAINYAATMFMIPLALHSAITVRVGQSLGANKAELARLGGWIGIAMCGLFMTASAVVLIVFRGPITSLYVNDPAVRDIAAGLLFMAMIFQISDGLQVGAAGALRGYKDTRIPLVLNIIAYWLVGFPVAYLAGLKLGYGPRGVWMGLAAGLTVATLLLCLRYRKISRMQHGPGGLATGGP